MENKTAEESGAKQVGAGAPQASARMASLLNIKNFFFLFLNRGTTGMSL